MAKDQYLIGYQRFAKVPTIGLPRPWRKREFLLSEVLDVERPRKGCAKQGRKVLCALLVLSSFFGCFRNYWDHAAGKLPLRNLSD
jgi:hypothetical protein